MTPEDKIKAILTGIDLDSPADESWWETSTGAEFGARKLEEVLAVVRGLETKIQEQDARLKRIGILLADAIPQLESALKLADD